jgi:hypothetical protein
VQRPLSALERTERAATAARVHRAASAVRPAVSGCSMNHGKVFTVSTQGAWRTCLTWSRAPNRSEEGGRWRGVELTGARRRCRAAPVVGEDGHASGSYSEVIACSGHASRSCSEAIECSSHTSGSCSEVVGEVGHPSGSCSEVFGCSGHASGSCSEVGGCSGTDRWTVEPEARTKKMHGGSLYRRALHQGNAGLHKEREREVTAWHGGRASMCSRGA